MASWTSSSLLLLALSTRLFLCSGSTKGDAMWPPEARKLCLRGGCMSDEQPTDGANAAAQGVCDNARATGRRGAKGVGGVSKASALAASVVARRRKLRESCKHSSLPRLGLSDASTLSCNVTLPPQATSFKEMLVDEGAGSIGTEDNSKVNDTGVDRGQEREKPATGMAAAHESVRLEEEDRAAKLSRAKKAILDAGEGGDFGLSDTGKMLSLEGVGGNITSVERRQRADAMIERYEEMGRGLVDSGDAYAERRRLFLEKLDKAPKFNDMHRTSERVYDY